MICTNTDHHLNTLSTIKKENRNIVWHTSIAAQSFIAQKRGSPKNIL